MKPKRWTHCNILNAASDGRQWWQFASASKGRVQVVRSEKAPVGQAIASKWVAKDWRVLLQPRLNVAWLPSKQVYLRAVALPAATPEELSGMIEFQLEKLSPLPVTQAVWTAEILPNALGKSQVAIVAIAERAGVEKFLGKLEETGYQADRLEIPFLRELRALPSPESGVWVFLKPEHDGVVAMTVWWTQGVLQELNVSHWPPGTVGVAPLIEGLSQTAWAGEVGGWLESLPAVTIFAPTDIVSPWENALREWSAQSVEVREPMTVDRVAELTAQETRLSSPVSMIPAEITQRYQQKFIDTVWVRGLGALGLAYLIGALTYLVILNWRTSQLDDLKASTLNLAKQYTNTLSLKAQTQILQDQINLKYAGLECWRAAIDKLPERLTLTSLDFQRGKTLVLNGTAPPDAGDQVIKYNSDLKTVMAMNADGTPSSVPLFEKVNPSVFTVRGAGATWRFEAELKKQEIQ